MWVKNITKQQKSSTAYNSKIYRIAGYYCDYGYGRAFGREDKNTVNRARKVQRFLSQPFSVAEQFTGMQGKYVPIKETIRGFKEIIEGKCDDIPESCFLFAGGIDEVREKAKKMGE